MSRTQKPERQAGVATQALEVQRIRVNRDGYDRGGAYWGAGPDVFIVTTQDAKHEITVRAKTTADAKAQATARLIGSDNAVATAPRQPLGGASPHKTRYETTWRDPIGGGEVRIAITHERAYLSSGSDHLEIRVLAPCEAHLPITETGYRSHFLPPLELINAGGPVTYVTIWLDREAQTKAWKARTAKVQQGDLFQWAEAKAETVKRTRKTPAQGVKPPARKQPARSPRKPALEPK